MRAREFTSEAGPASPQTAAQIIGSKTSGKTPPDPRDDTNRLASLGEPVDTSKPPGMLKQIAGSAAQGFKAGLGMDPQQSLGTGIAAKALKAMNMPATATATTGDDDRSPYTDKYTLSPQQLQQFRVGAQIKHPKLGLITVKKSSPQGVTFDTTRALGHDFSMRPYQVRQLGGS